MKLVNAGVFVGLVLSGIMLAIGMLSANGSLMGLATYFGWFFATLSIAIYLITSVLHLVNPRVTFWKDLYALNLGLTILGISAFGFTGQEPFFTFIVSAGAAITISLLLFRLNAFIDRSLPVSILVLLLIPALPVITSFWMYVYFTLGIILILVSLLKGCMKLQPQH